MAFFPTTLRDSRDSCENIPDQNVRARKIWCFDLFRLLNDMHFNFIPPVSPRVTVNTQLEPQSYGGRLNTRISKFTIHLPRISTFQNYCKQISNQSLCRFMINPTLLHKIRNTKACRTIVTSTSLLGHCRSNQILCCLTINHTLLYFSRKFAS